MRIKVHMLTYYCIQTENSVGYKLLIDVPLNIIKKHILQGLLYS